MKLSQSLLVSVWVLASLLLACEPSEPSSRDEATTPPADTLRERVLQSLLEADEVWNRSTVSADSFTSFFTDDALWVWVGGERVNGIEEIRRIAEGGWARPGFSLDWESTSVGVSHSHDVGFTAGEWHSSYEGGDGVVNERNGSYMAIWRKDEDGKWKVEIEIEVPGQAIFRQP